MSGKIRVLIVDDSALIRRLVSQALSEDREIEVVGVAANGKIALAKVGQLHPDAITLDMEMPEMDGIATLEALQQTHPHLPVVMFSALTKQGAESTFDALSKGASDYVTKPTQVGHLDKAMPSRRSCTSYQLASLYRSSSCNTCRRCSRSIWPNVLIRLARSRYGKRKPAMRWCRAWL